MKKLIYFLAFVLLSACSKDQTEECNCELPFHTGNGYTTFLAINGVSYWYNDECWKYLGPSKSKNDTPPSNPSINSTEWSKCNGIEKDCATISDSAQIWSPGIYYSGDIVNLNDTIYIAFTQGNPKPGSPNDDIWAVLCK